MRGGPADRVRRDGLFYLKHHTKAGWNSWRAVQNMTAGQSALGAVKFSGAAKAKRRRHLPLVDRHGIARFLDLERHVDDPRLLEVLAPKFAQA